jgi:hypothetical protein
VLTSGAKTNQLGSDSQHVIENFARVDQNCLVNMATPQYISIVSMDGHEFVLDRKCAMMSGTIRSMLEGDFIEGS